MAKLSQVEHLLIDMDGVLYRGNAPMPRLKEFFAFLRTRPIAFRLATNNSSKSPQQYVDKLAGMGVEVWPSEVVTSGLATARFLQKQYPAGTRVHVFGMDALRQVMTEAGFVLADRDVEVVVASMDREITYEKLKRATLLIRGGARFVATNLDPTQPTEEGLLPGTGSYIAALATASGTQPESVGKPEPTLFVLGMESMGATPGTTAVLGDRVDTDLVGGRRAGLATIAVLSGSSSPQEIDAFAPDFVYADIGALLDAWQAELGQA